MGLSALALVPAEASDFSCTALVTYIFFKRQVQGIEILEAKVMFFAFSTFTKINIVVNMSAARRISVGRNPSPPVFFFFHSPTQPNSIFFLVTFKSKLLGLKFK